MKIIGAKAHAARLKRLHSEDTVRKVGAALFAGGQIIQVEAQHSITEGSVGGKHHVPSKPGEPPNADTGSLDRQIETLQVAPLKVEVSSNAPHAVPLEVGTSRMAARPSMGPAAQRKRGEVTLLVRDAVNKVLREP